MSPADWLLLLIAARPSGGGLDPIRLQKGMFLLARESEIAPRERYWFVPYNYGPMSPAIYRDAEALVADGLAERLPVPGYSWTSLAATVRGRERAERLAEGIAPGRLVGVI